MALVNSTFIGKTQNYLHHGPPKLQNAINEIQSMVIFIVQKDYRQTLTKKSLWQKKSLWRLITHCISLTVSLMNFKRVKNVNIFTAKIFRIILNGKTLLYSGLFWKFQRQYRDKNSSLGFHQVVNREQSNQAREKTHRSDMWTCGEGRWLWWKIGWRKIEKREERKNQWRKAVVCTINKICTGEKISRDTSEDPQEPKRVS